MAVKATADEQDRPRYREIGEWLEEECGRLPAGALLPSEPQLADRFGVSRMTARHAPSSKPIWPAAPCTPPSGAPAPCWPGPAAW